MSKEIEVQITGKKIVFQLADDISVEDFMRVVEYVENKINKIKFTTLFFMKSILSAANI